MCKVLGIKPGLCPCAGLAQNPRDPSVPDDTPAAVESTKRPMGLVGLGRCVAVAVVMERCPMVHAAALSLRIVRCRAWDGSQALGRTRGSELDLSRLEGSGALRVVLSLSLFCNARVALALHSFWESRIFAKYCINH